MLKTSSDGMRLAVVESTASKLKSLVMVGAEVQTGDHICLLRACSKLIALRPKEATREWRGLEDLWNQHYHVLCGVYICGDEDPFGPENVDNDKPFDILTLH
jgi:hypothetical protein